MGGSNAGITTKIDTAIGTIVWVRRRNGSWWPGRILGTDELSATHLMSPRSGTPVKLLGRDDANLGDCRRDWYNIEKSKRVKAFRCGEYDDCIERAKAYANLPAKKVVKYARREDAILHALELEKNHLKQKEQSSCLEAVHLEENKSGSVANQSQVHVPGSYKDDCEHNFEDYSDFLEPDSPLDALQSVVSFQQTNPENAAGSLSVHKVKRTSGPDWEDDGTEGTTRMRGLQDFGLRIAPQKKLSNMAAQCEGIPKVIIPEGVHCPPYAGRGMGCGSPANSSKGSSLTLKRKRSQVGPVQENFVKRRDRRRPLTKVLESSAKLSVPGFSDYDFSAIESVHKGIMRSEAGGLQSKQVKQSSLSAMPRNNLDYTGTSFKRETTLQASQHIYDSKDGHCHSVSVISDNACSNLSEDMDDKSFLHPDSHVEESTLTDFTPVYSSSTTKTFHTDMVGRGSNFPIEGQVTLTSKEGLDETGFSSYLCQPDSFEQSLGVVTDQGVSKWQSKGKRNMRTLNKKHCESSNGRSFLETSDACTALMHGIAFEDKVHSSEELRTKKGSNNTYEEPVSSEKGEQQLNHFLFPDVLLRDGSGESNVQFFDDGQHLRQVNSLPRTGADVEDLQRQEPDQYIQERNTGPFSSCHSWAMSLSKGKNTRCESSLTDEKVLINNWLGQTDMQEHLWQQKMSITEGFDSETSPGVKFEGTKSPSETEWDFSDPLRVPKLVTPVAQDLSDSGWFDVSLDVQATYQGEHVPLVSLMSRLNGKAIVGHPVTVETLEDGYCDALFADYNFMSEPFVNYRSAGAPKIGKRAVQPSWRTARRTDRHRVPRCCPSRKRNESCNLSQLSGSQNGQLMVKAGYVHPVNYKGRYIRKHTPHVQCPSLDKKLPKKLMKRAGLSSKKTRTLSSIAVEHESKYDNSESRPLKLSEAPLVTCIPVKLVFSRIKEAVGNSLKAGSCGLSSSGSGE